MSTSTDCMTAVSLRPQTGPDGHVIAVRVTSENADDGFKPTCGRIDELHFRSTPEVCAYQSQSLHV